MLAHMGHNMASYKKPFGDCPNVFFVGDLLNGFSHLEQWGYTMLVILDIILLCKGGKNCFA